MLSSIAFVSFPTAHISAKKSVDAVAVIQLTNQPFSIESSGPDRFAMQEVADATSVATLTVMVRPRVVSRESLRAIANRDVIPERVVDSMKFGYTGLERNAQGRVLVPTTFNITDRTTTGLDIPAPGIYPVTLQVANGENVIARTTTFIVRPEPQDILNPIHVSIIAGYESPISHTADGNIEIADQSRILTSRVVDAMDRSTATLSASFTPEFIDGLASSSNPLDTALFERVRTSIGNRPLVSQTYVSVDPSRLVAERLGGEIAYELDNGDATISRLLPTASVVRSVFVSRSILDQPGALALSNVGVNSLVLSRDSLKGVDQLARPGVMSTVQVKSGVPVKGVLSLDGIESLFDITISPFQRGARLAAEIVAQRADLVATGVKQENIHIVVDTVGQDVPLQQALVVAASSLATVDGVRVVDISDIVNTAASATPIELPNTPAYESRSLATVMRSLNGRIDALSTMLDQNDPLMRTWTSKLAIIPGLQTNAEINKYVAGLQASLTKFGSSISVSAGSGITLSSRNGVIRVRLRNDSDSRVTVKIRLSSVKLQFPKGIQTVTIEPKGNADVSIPVTARSNGKFPVTVRLTTPRGQVPVGAPVVVTARVNALAGLGQLVSVAIALVLLAWWFNHWRKARRIRVLESTTD